VVGTLHDVGPGETQHGPTRCHERVLADPVPLKAVAGRVPRPAVDLDGKAYVGKRHVEHTDPRDHVLRHPPTDAGSAEQADQAALGLGPSAGGSHPHMAPQPAHAGTADHQLRAPDELVELQPPQLQCPVEQLPTAGLGQHQEAVHDGE
jgi:hypothetical protein